MRAMLVTGVLGAGTALVFAAAALTAALFPNGTVVNTGWNGGMWDRGWGGAVPMPMPGLVAEPDIRFDPAPIEVPVNVDKAVEEAVEEPTPAP